MNKKLIFLHIPKSAGTSQRTIFYDLYGNERSFWYGITTTPSSRTYAAHEVEHATLVGGHKGIKFYPQDIDALYCSLVREPISRVVSLFRHYAGPEGGDNGQPEAKKKLQQLWLQKGMDSRSIVKSINESSEFRNHIENFQCRFLSRYGGTFSGVMKTLEESDFVIGSSQNVAVFNKYLSDLLGWGDVPRRIKNANRKSGRESILSEHGAFELIESLVAEDIKLHDYIDQECNTLYSNIDDPETVKSCLSVKRGYSKRVPGRVSKKINTYCKGYLGIDKQGYGSTGICIINNSDTALGGRRMPGLEIYYDLYDGKQQHLGTGKNTLKLPRPIPAGGFIELSFSIAVEEPIRHKVAYISVGLQNPGQLKFSDKQPLHNATAMIFNVDD